MEDRFLKKAFDIGEIPDDIDLTIPPVTGLDYLYRVRLETRTCPKVVVSNIDTTKYLSNQTVTIDICNGFVRARPGFEPTIAWRDQQLELFCSYRDKTAQHRDYLKLKFPKKQHSKINTPQDWCLFCLGSEARDRFYNSESSHPAKRSRPNESGTGPLLSVILHFNQTRVIKLLSYHIDWMEELGFCHSLGRWIYALLSCLEKPLDPDTCSLLRMLSRVSSRIRDNLPSPDHEFLDPLNVILVVVSHYFDQKDMSDTFATND